MPLAKLIHVVGLLIILVPARVSAVATQRERMTSEPVTLSFAISSFCFGPKRILLALPREVVLAPAQTEYLGFVR